MILAAYAGLAIGCLVLCLYQIAMPYFQAKKNNLK